MSPLLLVFLLFLTSCHSFKLLRPSNPLLSTPLKTGSKTGSPIQPLLSFGSSKSSKSSTQLGVADLSQISLAASQENTGLAIVVVGEAVYSFTQAPSLGHAKILLPAIASAVVLFMVAGPPLDVPDVHMIDGLSVAAGVSAALMGCYYLRLTFPSPSPKENAFGGLVIGFLGFASFVQNMFAGGWLAFPTLPSISLPF
ncbi:hypothetical protein TrVE_jg3448 [Triparma verrucosa]|uniref:Uncharacterized protein n=2 Tax=Triparma TaxID=722752 RepID=A0A9W7DYY9_9STRA|nr:hypothetical protein TrST_g2437 [Triparma strigata]GMH90098.1 hypothetical protein TrVE_jg3448 [Triparma verrucosa]